MADTGAPWNLPYPLATDLVRDGAQAIEDLAEATADGLDAAGGLVAVKHVLKTNSFTSGGVAAGGNVAVPDLEIVHEVADAANRLIITAFFGVAANSHGFANVGIAVNEFTSGGTPENVLLAVGDTDGVRTRVTAGGVSVSSAQGFVVTMPHITFVHTPGAGEKTYTVRAINTQTAERTLFVGRSVNNPDNEGSSLGASALIIQEVKV